MSGDIASLGFAIDSSQAARATDNLDRMRVASIGATRSANDLSGAHGTLRDELQRVADQQGRMLQVLEQQNDAQQRIAQNTESSTGKYVALAAAVGTAYVAYKGFNEAADASHRAVNSLNDALDQLRNTVASAAAGLVSGDLFKVTTADALKQAEALRDLSRVQGITAGTLGSIGDAARATGLSADKTAGIFAHLTSVIEGYEAAAQDARAAAAGLGVDLASVTRENVPEAYQAIIGKLQQYRDDTAKTALAQQLLGTSGVDALKGIAAATEFTSDKIRRHNDLVAEAQLRSVQNANELEAIRNQPTWWDRLVQTIDQAISRSQEFKDKQTLLFQELQQSFEVAGARGVSGLFDGSLSATAGRIYDASGSYLRLFGNAIAPSFIAPPPEPTIQRDNRPALPDPNVAFNQTITGRLAASYAAAAQAGTLDPRTAAVQQARDAAQAAYLSQARGPTTELDQANISDLQDVASKQAGALFDKQKLDDLTTRYGALAQALNPLVAANENFTAGQRLINAALDAGVISADQAAVAVANLNQHYKDALDPIEAVRGKLDQERQALNLSGVDRRVYNEMIATTNTLKQRGVDLDANPAARNAIKAQITDIEQVKAAQDAALRAQQEFERVAQRTTDKITGYGAQAIDAFLNKGKVSDFFDTLVTTARRGFSEIIANALLRPIIQPLVVDVLGAVGGAGIVTPIITPMYPGAAFGCSIQPEEESLA